MEKCPTEVLSIIFVLLCCDGGHMGGVLRLVSKRIAAQARPFRFWSVCVSGPHQVERFERALVKVPRSQRRVKHLFVCDTTGYTIDRDGQQIARHFTDLDADLPYLYSLWSRWQRLQPESGNWAVDRAVSSVARKSADVVDAKNFDAIFGRLMAHVSLHLESLTILNTNPGSTKWKDHFRSRSLPQLEFLALYHCTSAWAPRIHAHMPSLRSVTLAFGNIRFWIVSRWLQYFIDSSNGQLQKVTFRGLEVDHFTRRHIHHLIGRDTHTAPEVSPIVPGWRVGLSDDDWEKQTPALSQPIPRVVLVDITPHIYPSESRTFSPANEWSRSRAEELRDDGLGDVSVLSMSLDYPQVKERWFDMLQQEVMRTVFV